MKWFFFSLLKLTKMKKAITGLAAFLFSLPIIAQLQFRSLEEVLAYADKNSLAVKFAQLAEEAASKMKKFTGPHCCQGLISQPLQIITSLFLP
jgi:hypothetical protein